MSKWGCSVFWMSAQSTHSLWDNKAVKKGEQWNGYSIKLQRVEKVKAVEHNDIIHRLYKTLKFWYDILWEKKIVTRTENGRTLIQSHDNICTQTGKCTTAIFVRSLLKLVTWLNFRHYIMNPCQQVLLIFNGTGQGSKAEWHKLYFKGYTQFHCIREPCFDKKLHVPCTNLNRYRFKFKVWTSTHECLKLC